MTVALQSLLAQTGLALGPLRDVNTALQAQALLRKLGYEVPVSAFSSALTALATAAGELVDAVKIVANATDDAELATARVTRNGEWATPRRTRGSLRASARRRSTRPSPRRARRT